LIEETRDAELLARIQFDTVSIAYKRFFPVDAKPPTPAAMARIWRERLSRPSSKAFLAIKDTQAIGAVAIGTSPEFRDEAQLLGLHVLPSHWGRGVGKALHHVATTGMVGQGFTLAGLWVIEANDRARRMYERLGWMLRPELKLHDLGISEVRYRLELSELRRPSKSR